MARRRGRWLAAITLLASSVAVAAPDQPKDPHAYIWQRIMAELEAASASLEPKRKPPKPVKVRYAATRIASVDLKAPILAVAIANVDTSDKAAELVAVTTREVVVLALQRRTFRRGGRTYVRRSWQIRARAGLPTELAQRTPRDPVGALVVADVDGDDKPEIFARSSSLAKGAVFQLNGGVLKELSRFVGFPLCAKVRARLSTGRNYFVSRRISWSKDTPRVSMPRTFYSAACYTDMVDPDGRPLRAFGRVTTRGSLYVTYTKECGRKDKTCRTKPTWDMRVKWVGTAWTVADLNNDGVPEVITSGINAPGMRDRVTVYTGATKPKRVFWRDFAGGVIGIAAGDIDGDGDRDVVAVVRILGATTVGTWLLN